jgi:hypothetical protein
MGKQSTTSEQFTIAKAERLMRALGEPDPLTVALRGRIRKFIETLVETELTEVLAAGGTSAGRAGRGIAMGGFSGR